MLRIRKTKTASGSTSVQIVYYRDRKVIVEKHIGSGKTEEAIGTLILKAQHWIESRSMQQELFALKEPLELSPQNLRLIGVTHQFTYQLLECIAVKCGMTMPGDRFLFDFSIMRLIEPTSKLRAITLLSRYFSIDYSERTVYRKMGTIIQHKKRIEAIAVQCAKNLLQDDLSMVLYDVTTLYFETFKSDELRKKEIIDRYHDLWHVEHSFRIAKSDLASRPIFHYKKQAIASHILICFTALMIAKYLEALTKLSLRQIIDAIWQIKEVLLLNTLTDTSFTIRSDFSLLAKEILRNIDPNLSY